MPDGAQSLNRVVPEPGAELAVAAGVASFRQLLRLGGCVALAAAQTACLSTQYEIHKDEIQRLAHADPDQRGRRVRVVQQTDFDEDELSGEPNLALRSHRTHYHVHPRSTLDLPASRRQYGGPPAVQARPAPAGNQRPGLGQIEPAAPEVAPAPRGPALPSTSGGASARVPATPGGGGVARAPAAPQRVVAPSSGARAASSGGAAKPKGTVLRSGGGGGGLGGGDGEALLIIAIIAVVAAAGVMAVYASTEGQRFDGWMMIPEEKPVLLELEDGSRYWMALGDIQPEDARHVKRAWIDEKDQELQRLERAPLRRRGFTYSLEMGAAQSSSTDGPGPYGFQSRVGLGGFFTQEFGLLFGAQFTAADRGGTIFNGRFLAELQLFLPWSYQGVHLGGYGEVGYGWVLQDLPGRTESAHGVTPGGGLLLQYDLTTRLALSLRLGATRQPALSPARRRTDPFWVPEAALGLVVY